MIETLSNLIDVAGPLAPLIYVSFFLATALLPFIPTPLISALGGSFLGSGPAIGYGIVGLMLGAILALNLSRHLGRPVMIKLIGKKAWDDWEYLLGIESPWVWGVIFFVLNIDFAVVAAGLSGLPLWQLWLAAVIARIPWLIASALFGEVLLRSDNLLPQAILAMVLIVFVINVVRRYLRKFLVKQQVEHGYVPHEHEHGHHGRHGHDHNGQELEPPDPKNDTHKSSVRQDPPVHKGN